MLSLICIFRRLSRLRLRKPSVQVVELLLLGPFDFVDTDDSCRAMLRQDDIEIIQKLIEKWFVPFKPSEPCSNTHLTCRLEHSSSAGAGLTLRTQRIRKLALSFAARGNG